MNLHKAPPPKVLPPHSTICGPDYLPQWALVGHGNYSQTRGQHVCSNRSSSRQLSCLQVFDIFNSAALNIMGIFKWHVYTPPGVPGAVVRDLIVALHQCFFFFSAFPASHISFNPCLDFWLLASSGYERAYHWLSFELFLRLLSVDIFFLYQMLFAAISWFSAEIHFPSVALQEFLNYSRYLVPYWLCPVCSFCMFSFTKEASSLDIISPFITSVFCNLIRDPSFLWSQNTLFSPWF